MLVPRTAEGFRATVIALRSLDGSKGVFSYLLPHGPLRAAAGQEPSQTHA